MEYAMISAAKMEVEEQSHSSIPADNESESRDFHFQEFISQKYNSQEYNSQEYNSLDPWRMPRGSKTLSVCCGVFDRNSVGRN